MIEPLDLKVNGMMITQEYLRRDYENVLRLLKLHEQELLLLWLMFFGILGVTIYRGRKLDTALKELAL